MGQGAIHAAGNPKGSQCDENCGGICGGNVGIKPHSDLDALSPSADVSAALDSPSSRLGSLDIILLRLVISCYGFICRYNLDTNARNNLLSASSSSHYRPRFF